jgi:hypothetical protein
MATKEIIIGMFGAGTVGGGAIEILKKFVRYEFSLSLLPLSTLFCQ